MSIQHPAVIILAAGHSERMGQAKYKLAFSEEETFFSHIIRVYRRFVVPRLIVVVNQEFDTSNYLFDENAEFVVNNNPELGRFHSIRLGLEKLKTGAAFVQNIDNPFVNAGLLIKLLDGLKDKDFAVPVYNGRGGHPVLLSSKIIHSLQNDFSSATHFDKALQSFQRSDVVVSDPYISVNINTPDDYRKYFLGG